MPRDGAIKFDDLIGNLDVLRGCCGLGGLIEKRGRDAKIALQLSQTPDRPSSKYNLF
jgi:hypothetical protein